MREGTLSDRLARLLFAYRNTPHSTTGASPSELMFGRRLTTRFDLSKPSREARVESNQQRQKKGHDLHARKRQFSLGDHVFVKNFANGPVWLSGRVSEVTGPCSCVIVTLQDGRIVRRHQDHIKRRSSSPGDAVEQPRMEMADPLPARQESQVTEKPDEATESEYMPQEESLKLNRHLVVPERRYTARKTTARMIYVTRKGEGAWRITNCSGGRSVVYVYCACASC